MKLILMVKKNYMECKVLRGFFSEEEFIGELLDQINPKIEIKHNLFINKSISKNIGGPHFFDDIFKPFLDENFLENAINNLKIKSPILLNQFTTYDSENLFIYLTNRDASEFDDKLELSINSTGAPEIYFPLILEKFINGKLKQNRISEHHPNILLINYLLDPSLQLASSLRRFTQLFVPTGLDTVFLSSTDIDRRINNESQNYIIGNQDDPFNVYLEQNLAAVRLNKSSPVEQQLDVLKRVGFVCDRKFILDGDDLFECFPTQHYSKLELVLFAIYSKNNGIMFIGRSNQDQNRRLSYSISKENDITHNFIRKNIIEALQHGDDLSLFINGNEKCLDEKLDENLISCFNPKWNNQLHQL